MMKNQILGFGVPKSTAFGFNTNQGSLFGQPSTSTASTGFGTFGNTATSAFSSPQTMNANGTAVAKFNPLAGTDTLMKGGQSSTVNTRQFCVTAMKEYEAKSLEELRLEDYMANRKGPQAGSVQPGGGLFGSTQQNTSIFGAPASQPQSTGLFGAPSTTNTALGGFGASPNTFGQTGLFISFLFICHLSLSHMESANYIFNCHTVISVTPVTE